MFFYIREYLDCWDGWRRTCRIDGLGRDANV